MDWFNVIVMGIGLAMDCCAVSVVQGLNEGKWNTRALLMAVIFGLFHCGMPIIGFYAGELATNFMRRYAPWIALGLLGTLGTKMIWESFHKNNHPKQANWHFWNLIALALATSVDVLATGLIFVPYPNWLYPAIFTIGGITACFSLGGYLLGVYVGKLKLNMEMVGGIVLILLGVKICIEGVCF
ncbi:MAG: manganese efflux pump [Paludibacteraceae bacterium]|nr:manganese efflux pump [Paludibacteraceae bacterium]